MELKQTKDGLPLHLGTGPYRRVHKNLETRPSKVAGTGLYVINEPMAAGTVILYVPGDYVKYTWKEIQEFSPEEQDFFTHISGQVDEDLFEGGKSEKDLEDDYSFLWNHSCDPNCWFINDEVMVARRVIQVDEELSYDYITSEEQRSLDLKGFTGNKCLCGASTCRGTVKALSKDDDELIERYNGHLYGHIQRKVDLWKAQKE